MENKWKINCAVHNILDNPYDGKFDGVFSLDVLEHISKDHEDKYMFNICASLDEQGVFIVGIPTLNSQLYASPRSKEGHINCKSYSELKDLMLKYFYNV